MSDWPKHPDGRNKKIGEMTAQEARAVAVAATEKLKAEFNNPQLRTAMAEILGKPTTP